MLQLYIYYVPYPNVHTLSSYTLLILLLIFLKATMCSDIIPLVLLFISIIYAYTMCTP